MTVAAVIAAEPVARPIEIVHLGEAAGLRVNDASGSVVAYLRAREIRLFAAAYRNVLDARVLGGLRTTIGLIDYGPDLPTRCAAAVRLSAGSLGVHASFLDRDGNVLAGALFDEARLARLTGDEDV